MTCPREPLRIGHRTDVVDVHLKIVFCIVAISVFGWDVRIEFVRRTDHQLAGDPVGRCHTEEIELGSAQTDYY